MKTEGYSDGAPESDFAELPTVSSGPLLRIGAFRVVGRLGQGGMGVVYRGEDEHLQRGVALKVLSPDIARDPGIMARFKIEAQAIARLNHRGIVQIYAFGLQGETPYIAMELLEGEDLHARVRRLGPLPAAEVVRVIRDSAEALAYAATRNVIHRDIKPSNLFLTSEGDVKVMDFGLAKRLDTETHVTVTGQVLGTPSFMSPEQIRGDDLDFRTDMYSLGCTLYTLLSGRMPYHGSNAMDAMVKHATEPLPLPPEWKKIAGGRLVAVLERMTRKEPARRYGSWDECIADLDAIERMIGATRQLSRGPGKSAARPPAPGLDPRMVGLGAIVGGAALVVVAVVLSSGSGPAPIAVPSGGATASVVVADAGPGSDAQAPPAVGSSVEEAREGESASDGPREIASLAAATPEATPRATLSSTPRPNATPAATPNTMPVAAESMAGSGASRAAGDPFASSSAPPSRAGASPTNSGASDPFASPPASSSASSLSGDPATQFRTAAAAGDWTTLEHLSPSIHDEAIDPSLAHLLSDALLRARRAEQRLGLSGLPPDAASKRARLDAVGADLRANFAIHEFQPLIDVLVLASFLGYPMPPNWDGAVANRFPPDTDTAHSGYRCLFSVREFLHGEQPPHKRFGQTGPPARSGSSGGGGMQGGPGQRGGPQGSGMQSGPGGGARRPGG